jgi:hypothetical protein
MNPTPLAENAGALKALKECAKELGMHLDEHHNLYDLPMGVKLQRFVGGDHILLVGQFAVDGGSDNPRRVYTVEVTRAVNFNSILPAWAVEIKEDERQLAIMTVPGSRCKAEYFGIKVLKADLHRRVRRNERKVAGKKRRAAATAKTETTN